MDVNSTIHYIVIDSAISLGLTCHDCEYFVELLTRAFEAKRLNVIKDQDITFYKAPFDREKGHNLRNLED